MLILHKIHLTCRKSSTLFSMSMHKMETYFPSVSHYLFGSITAVIHHWSGGERHEKCDFSLLLLFFFSVILLFLFSTVTFCCLGAAGVKLLNFCCFPSELYSAGEKLVSRSPHQHIGSGCRQRLSCRRDSFQILWCVSQIVACLLVRRF